MLAALVAASDLCYAAILPALMASAMAPGLGLRVAELPLDVTADPTLIAWHPRHDADPAHAWLRDTVRQVLSDPGWAPPPMKPWGARAAA